MFRSKAKELQEKRDEALACARHQRSKFEEMRLRSIASGETPDATLLDEFRSGMHACEQRMQQEQDIDEFATLISQAEALGQLRAYLCPLAELADEASRAIDQMEDWGVSRGSLKLLRKLTATILKDARKSPREARGALRAVLEDWDMWMTYTDDYEEDTGRICWTLLIIMSLSFAVAVVALYFSQRWWPLLVFSTAFAGITGSCASVLARMPTSEVTSSSASESLARRTLSRVGTGMAASIAGCALLAWGVIPIVVNGISFADVLNRCGPSGQPGCTPASRLVLLAIPIMFGFSERILTSLEEKLFGRAEREARAESSEVTRKAADASAQSGSRQQE